MIDNELLSQAAYLEEYWHISESIPERADILEWSQSYLDLIDGKLTLTDVRDQVAEDNTDISALVRLAGFSTEPNVLHSRPQGSTLGLFSTSPRVLVDQIIKNSGILPSHCPDFSSRDKIKAFLEKTTPVRDYMVPHQMKNWSFTFDQAADFLWNVRTTNPVLFFLLISREYDQAKKRYPWVAEPISDLVVHIAKACFPDLKTSPLVAMQVIGSAQRFREMLVALEPYAGLKIEKLKALSEADDLAGSASGSYKRYLATIGSSVFALRQVLMLDCSRPELLPKGNQLWIIANPEERTPLVDRVLLGLGNNAAKALLGDICGEISAASPTGRPAGNGGKGNDSVERTKGTGGRRIKSLPAIFGFGSMGLACRFVRQSSNDCASRSNDTSVGTFAQMLIGEACPKLSDENSDASARAKHARLERAYGERANTDFGSPSSMMNFGYESWCRSGDVAGNWKSLAEHTDESTPDRKYFLIVRRYLHGFFPAIARKWKLHDASEAWSELAKCATAFSRDPIWILLRNREAKMLDISADALRDAASKAKGKPPREHKGTSPAQFKTEMRGFGHLI